MAWGPLTLSFQVATMSVAITLVAGVALAALLTWRRLPGRELLDAVLTMPLVLPPTVLGYYLLVALGRDSAIGSAYEAVIGSPIVFTRAGAVIAASVGALPLVIKSARASLEAVDPDVLAAARTLGAGPARTFATVALPLARRGILAGAVLAFAKALGDFGATLMVAGDIPGRTQTASLFIYDAIQAGREAEAAGTVAVLTAAAIAALYAVNRTTGRRGDG